MNQARVHRCLDAGLSIVVGTVSRDGMPSCCRAIAIASDDDLATLTIYLPVVTSHDVIQNIALTKRLAVTASQTAQYTTWQLKGTTIDARIAREDEAAFLRARIETFADALDGFGVPRRITRSLTHWPAFAVTMRVEHVFDQTPGPNAGNRLR